MLVALNILKKGGKNSSGGKEGKKEKRNGNQQVFIDERDWRRKEYID